MNDLSKSTSSETAIENHSPATKAKQPKPTQKVTPPISPKLDPLKDRLLKVTNHQLGINAAGVLRDWNIYDPNGFLVALYGSLDAFGARLRQEATYDGFTYKSEIVLLMNQLIEAADRRDPDLILGNVFKFLALRVISARLVAGN